MSLASTMAALEEFTEDVNSEIVQEQPEDGAFDEPVAGVDFTQDSGEIDATTDDITNAAQGLEDIISLINDAPGDDDAPMEPFVEKAVNHALEDNEMVASTGNPLAKTDDEGKTETKSGAIEKVKAFAAKVWEMLRNFGKRVAAWIRETWAKYTDRIVKNSNAAKQIIEQEKSLASRSGAKITDAGLLAKIATYQNTEVGDVVVAVFEHAQDQGAKASLAITKEARTCVELVANGATGSEDVMERFLKALQSGLGTYKDKATAEQAQAVPKNAAGTDTYLSSPFFAGYRAWTVVPENADKLELWNHGISKIDEVKAAESVDAPDPQEIKAIAEHIAAMGALVATYQANIKQLDDLNKALDAAAAKAKNSKAEDGALKKMNAVIPRVIKGPQVAAYGYAASASTVALQFCQAAINAHKAGEEAKPETAEAA